LGDFIQTVPYIRGIGDEASTTGTSEVSIVEGGGADGFGLRRKDK